MSALNTRRKNYDLASINLKIDALSRHIGYPLDYIRRCPYDPELLLKNIENPIGFAHVPIGLVGPVHVAGKAAEGDFYVPMGTTEGALALTYDLGAKLLRSSPIQVSTVKKAVHISPMFITDDEDNRKLLHNFVIEQRDTIKAMAEFDSSHTTLLDIDEKPLGDMVLLRFQYGACDAHGLNMINNATFKACLHIEKHTGIKFHHRSHYSGVKHHSPLNEEIGYGYHLRASALGYCFASSPRT